MASGNTLATLTRLDNLFPAWLFVAFTSGSTEPSPGDTIYGDTSAANARLEYIALTSGTWGGGDAAGYMLLSNWNGSAWTSGENFTGGADTASNHGTLTGTPVDCYATADTRNNKPVLDFDDTVNEVALFQGYMPRHYDGGGITLTLALAATSATSGTFSFSAFLMSITAGADNIASKVFAAPNANSSITIPGTAGLTVDAAIAFTAGADMDSIAAGEWFYLLIMRNAAGDSTGDAELVGVEIKET